jgi:uncharacterized protein YdaU (DUF1376 family)
VGDLLADTMDFSPALFGAYMKILIHQWVSEQPMTQKEMLIASGLSKNIFQKNWSVLEKKFSSKNGKYFSPRMAEEIAKSRAKSRKAAESAHARWNANAYPNALRTHDGSICSSDASHSHSHKEKEKETKRKPKSRGTRLPENWYPSEELFAWAANERPDLNIPKTIDKFCDYWHSVPGSKGVKLKWDLVFRNWIRNEGDNGISKQSGGTTGRQLTPSERAREKGRQYLARIADGNGDIVGEDDRPL